MPHFEFVTPQQWEYATSQADEVLISGAWGAGKSYPLCVVLYLRALTPGAREGLFRRTLQKLQETTLVTLLEGDGQTPAVIPRGTYHHNQNKRTIKIHNGGTIFYGPAETIEDVNAHNLTGVHVDEATELREEIWLALGARCRVKVEGLKPQQRGACNPGPPSHHLAKRFGIRKNRVVPELAFKGDPATPIRCHAIMTKSFDNPKLPTEARAKYASYTGITRLRFVEGQWVGSDGLIYDNFDRDRHARAVDTTGWPRALVGIDDGTTAPACFLHAHVSPNGRLHISREIQRAGMQLAEKKLAVTEAGEVEAVIVDPAASGLKLELRREGHPVLDADNAVEPGIQAVREYLNDGPDGEPLLTIDPSCSKLLEQMESYERNPDTLKETPIKENDHGCLVATTTVETPSGPRLIGTIREGDRVLTRYGYRRVAASTMTNAQASTMTVLHERGSLRGTPDHPVWTENRGWVRIDALRYSDILLAWPSQDQSPPPHERPRPGTGTPTTDTRPPRTGAHEGTSAGAGQATRPPSTCTTRSGSTTTAPSRPGTTSTTATTTRATTASRTSSASPATSTRRATPSPSGASAPSSTAPAWPGPAPRPPNGTARQQAEPGTEATPRAGSHHGAHARATPAANPSAPPPAAGSAPAPAGPQPADAPARTTNSGPASTAEHPSPRTDTCPPGSAPSRVLSVTADPGSRPVYNLEVEGDHEYIANGVLVHNCDALRYLVKHIHNPPPLVFDTSTLAEAEERARRASPPHTGALRHARGTAREQDLSIAAGLQDDVLFDPDEDQGGEDHGPLKLWCELFDDPQAPNRRRSYAIFAAPGDGASGEKATILVADMRKRELAAQWTGACAPEKLARITAMLALWFGKEGQPAAVQHIQGTDWLPGYIFGQHMHRLHVGSLAWEPTPSEFAEAIGLLRAAWEGGQLQDKDTEPFKVARQYVYSAGTMMHASILRDPGRRSSHTDPLIARAGLWRMLSESPRGEPEKPEPPFQSLAWQEMQRKLQEAREPDITYG